MSKFDPQRSQQIAPSRDPRRREVLIICELDVSNELEQRIEIREMRRKAGGKLKAVSSITELSEEQIVPVSALLLSFLAGFAELQPQQKAKQLSLKIFQQRLLIERSSGNNPF